MLFLRRFISSLEKQTASSTQRRKGFTLVELLLVIAIIALLMFLTIQSINPTKQLGQARNAQRRQDVNTIVNAVYQYMIDKNPMPTTIPQTSPKEICRTGAELQCSGGVVLSELNKYLEPLPVDPQSTQTGTGTNYWIMHLGQNRITVLAPKAEDGEVINLTR